MINKSAVKIISNELWSDLERFHGSHANKLTNVEEYATYWLWAYPELLGWGCDVQWLFSPVVGRRNYPGDLWGIDEQGQLIIIETKRGRQGQDPFLDFLDYEKQEGHLRFLSNQALEKRWNELYKKELEFINNHLEEIKEGRFKETTARGVVPYSSKRVATHRWPALYAQCIAHLITGDDYRRKVESYLAKREQREEDFPYYIGLVLVDPGYQPKLSPRGLANHDLLIQIVGAERVVLRGISAHVVFEENWTVEVVSWQPNT